MAPKTIYIIRHCDKPDENVDGCTDVGYQRALLLAGLNGSCEENLSVCNNKCSGNFTGTGFWDKELKGQKPTKLLAPLSKNDKPNSLNTYNNEKCTSSNRCCLILNPTAARYNMIINEDGKYFCDDQGSDLGNFILNSSNFDNGIIIIAWEHKDIHNLVNALGVNPTLDKWPKDSSDRFDLVFKIDFINNNPTLTILTQNLGLPGDSNTDPFEYKTNALRGIKQNNIGYNTNNNIIKIIAIIIGIILFIILICCMIYFFRK